MCAPRIEIEITRPDVPTETDGTWMGWREGPDGTLVVRGEWEALRPYIIAVRNVYDAQASGEAAG